MEPQDIFLGHQVLGALFSAAHKIRTRGDEYLQELSLRQMMVMAALIHLPEEEATINHIARMLGTTKQSAKQVIDILEKKQYCKVSPNKRDKRALNVTITPLGEEINRKCGERFNAFTTDVFDTYTREDLELLIALLQKLRGGPPSGFVDNMRPYTSAPATPAEHDMPHDGTERNQNHEF